MPIFKAPGGGMQTTPDPTLVSESYTNPPGAASSYDQYLQGQGLPGTGASGVAPLGTPTTATPGSNTVDFSFLENFQNPYSGSSSFNTSRSEGGLLPALRGDLGDVIGQLRGFTPTYRTALNRLMGLPEQIDADTAERLKQFRVRGEDVSDALSQAANLRAGRGIMGGTEGQNLRANLLSELMQRVETQREGVLDTAQQQKIASILGATSAAGTPMSILPSLFGAGTFSESAGEGGGESYQEDTTAGLNALMGLLRSGTTGG